MPRFTAESARIASRKGNIARWSPAIAKRLDPAALGITHLDAESRWVKQGLSREIRSQVLLLEETPCRTLAKLANGPDGEGRASLVARITDTAAKVYGWDSEKGNSVVLIGLVSSMDPESAPVIDAEVVA